MEANTTDLRRKNLKRLLARYDSQKDLAEATGLVPAHISQIISGKRNMGDAAASRIEHRLKLQHGAMDAPDFEYAEPPKELVRQDHRAKTFTMTDYSGPSVYSENRDAVCDEVLRLLSIRGIGFEDVALDTRINTAFGVKTAPILVREKMVIDLLLYSESYHRSTIEHLLCNAMMFKHANPQYHYSVVFVPSGTGTERASPERVRQATERVITATKAAIDLGYVVDFAFANDDDNLSQLLSRLF
jgi:hypothetical protein